MCIRDRFFDHLISALGDRFLNHKEIISSLQFVIPSRCNVPYEKIKYCVTFHKEDLESTIEDLVKAEWDLWKLKWHHSTDRPKTAIDGLVSCSQSQFPNIYILLQMLAI